ncbi:hypothetical protein JCM10207_003860 [Rhodosporidiobolus poonsookiae]
MAHNALHEARTVDSPILASLKGAGDEGKEHGDEGARGQAGSSALERLPDELLDLIFIEVLDPSNPAPGMLRLSKRLLSVVQPILYRRLEPSNTKQTAYLKNLASRPDLHAFVHSLRYCYKPDEPSSTLAYECAIIVGLRSLKKLELVICAAQAAVVPKHVTDALRLLPNLTELHLEVEDFDRDRKSSVQDYTFNLDVLPNLRRLTVDAGLGVAGSRLVSSRVPRSLQILSVDCAASSDRVYTSIPWQKVVSLSVIFDDIEHCGSFASFVGGLEKAATGTSKVVPLQHLALTDVTFLKDGSIQEFGTIDHLRHLFNTLALTKIRSLALSLATPPKFPPHLPKLDTVVHLTVEHGVDFRNALTFPTLIIPLALSQLCDISNSMIEFSWKYFATKYRYVRSSTTDDFQVDRIKLW